MMKQLSSRRDSQAIKFFDNYLHDNVVAAETLRRMQPLIQEFMARAPSVCVWKCVDGRVHGSKAKGYPTGTITFARTEGANIDVSISNIALWDRINAVVADARKRTPGKPALFIAFAHRSDTPSCGCAAHGLNDEKALNAVLVQTQRIRESYHADDLYVIAGMTNTDDMSETLYFSDGTQINTGDIIRSCKLKDPSDVFSKEFLQNPIDDSATREFVKHRTVHELLKGTLAPMYRDLEATVAMESYLLRQITEIENRNGKGAQHVVQQNVFNAVYRVLKSVKGLPPALRGALLYQCIWNIGFALYRRKRIASYPQAQRLAHLDHAEQLVCYGEGYETLPRNFCILVKPGRGNDVDALAVARRVLLKNRDHRVQKHPPLVHINVEVAGSLEHWQAFDDKVESRIMTRQRTIYEVFGDDVRILSTYSYKNKKEFYPVRITDRDPREVYPENLTVGMLARDFTKLSLDHREFSYTQKMLAKKGKIHGTNA
jgi:hypothetical protein